MRVCVCVCCANECGGLTRAQPPHLFSLHVSFAGKMFECLTTIVPVYARYLNAPICLYHPLTHIHIYIHTHAHSHIHTHTRTCPLTYTHNNSYTNTPTHTRSHTYTLSTSLLILISHTHVHTLSLTHTTLTHTHTHTHSKTCAPQAFCVYESRSQPLILRALRSACRYGVCVRARDAFRS
jgi:hypothetical protein